MGQEVKRRQDFMQRKSVCSDALTFFDSNYTGKTRKHMYNAIA